MGAPKPRRGPSVKRRATAPAPRKWGPILRSTPCRRTSAAGRRPWGRALCHLVSAAWRSSAARRPMEAAAAPVGERPKGRPVSPPVRCRRRVPGPDCSRARRATGAPFVNAVSHTRHQALPPAAPASRHSRCPRRAMRASLPPLTADKPLVLLPVSRCATAWPVPRCCHGCRVGPSAKAAARPVDNGDIGDEARRAPRRCPIAHAARAFNPAGPRLCRVHATRRAAPTLPRDQSSRQRSRSCAV